MIDCTQELKDILKTHGNKVIPIAVMESILKAWPDQAMEILSGIGFAGDHYFFNRWGMYVGVEYDGYIHT